ncbi:unnamed protein product [Acanthoscelides obtectus]|uniref:Uncharacterized protein n=1 Tax=Acanthoscelides obtectus TaxID=200917 RepID=A0A9P0L6V0_ACAOB|nr:unnamed protein product [Acanthoscelides obtectus]CAK1674547.1 hypothetical protein AOBTE_LOCUS29653 [Acanthoscelides obtectus]
MFARRAVIATSKFFLPQSFQVT